MRVLFIVPEFSSPGGGIATFYREAGRALVAAGAHVEVMEGSAFIQTERSETPQDFGGIGVRRLVAADARRVSEQFSRLAAEPQLRSHLAAAWAMAEAVRFGEGYDVVETTDWGLLFVPFVILGRTPCVVQCHGSIGQIAYRDAKLGQAVPEAIATLLEAVAMTYAGDVQTSSQANAREWSIMLHRHVHVIRPSFGAPSGIASDRINELGIVFGRMQRWKGPETLVRALEIMGHKAPTIHWHGRDVVWGEAGISTWAHLSALHPLVCGTRFQFHPPVAPKAVATLQARARFNLVPSDWDVFNFTAVEALASGRPTIVSTGAGASELIDHGKNGFVFPAGDAAELASAMAEVMALPADQIARVGAAGRETIVERLSPQRIAEERMERYRTVASQPTYAVPPPIAALAMPDAPGGETPADAFLEAYPMRLLASHFSRRLRRRIS